LARHMSKWMDQVMGPPYQKYFAENVWSPAINLYESETDYYLVVDLAGVEVDEEIDLHVEDTRLTLAGRRSSPAPPVKDAVRLHLMEIDHGRFCRDVEVPKDVDVEAIHASYRTGFLWVRMPKKIAGK